MMIAVIITLVVAAGVIAWALSSGATSGSSRVSIHDLPVIDPRDAGQLQTYIRNIDPTHKKETYYVAQLASGADFGIGVTPGYPWLDIITRTRRKGEKGGVFTGEYAEFGFNVDRRGWSYGDGPPCAREIRQILAKHTGREL